MYHESGMNDDYRLSRLFLINYSSYTFRQLVHEVALLFIAMKTDVNSSIYFNEIHDIP